MHTHIANTPHPGEILVVLAHGLFGAILAVGRGWLLCTWLSEIKLFVCACSEVVMPRCLCRVDGVLAKKCSSWMRQTKITLAVPAVVPRRCSERYTFEQKHLCKDDHLCMRNKWCRSTLATKRHVIKTARPWDDKWRDLRSTRHNNWLQTHTMCLKKKNTFVCSEKTRYDSPGQV